MVTGERQAAEIRSVYLKTVLRQEVGYFDKQAKAGEIVERMSGDTVLIQDAMGEKVGKFLQLATTLSGGFIVAFTKGWLLTLVMLSLLPVLAITSAIMSKAISKMKNRRQSAVSVAATVVDQTIGSIRTLCLLGLKDSFNFALIYCCSYSYIDCSPHIQVASFIGEKRAIDKYKKLLTKDYRSGVQEGLAAGLGYGVAMFLLFCCYGLAVWFGGKMIIENGYSGGDVASIVIAILTASLSLGEASPCISSFAAGKAGALKLFETINRKPEIDAYDRDGQKLDDIRGSIELRDVSFSYPSRPNELILNQFSLTISSGTTVALVGQSGSGKSTVISLVERFYDPQAGEVLIDGVNLKEFRLKWIRQKTGLVSEEPALFTCSIRDNIAYGKDGATAEEIRAAAELANAAKFIDKLPQGVDTMVGEHGTKLSGGQKQRVAIARAILRDPRILLLDEATSSLDAESERVVQEALDRVMINGTTVIVAHRLSTVRNADTIAVINRGKIMEKGCKLVKRTRSMCFEKVVYMEISWFDEAEHSSGAIAARLSVDAAFVRGLVGDTLALLVQNAATVTAGLVIAFKASWQVAFIILLMLPLQGINVYTQLKFMKGFREDAKKMFEEAGQVVKDAVGSIRTVASFCAEEKMMKLYNFYAGAQLVADGKTQFSNVFRVFFALTMMAGGISFSSSLAPDTSKAKTAVTSIFAILDRKSKIDSSDDSGTTMESEKGDIEFFHVSFNYPTRPDIQICKDLCLAIHSGKTVALVGESGSGKSTVIALLQRFYEPNSGHITLDGIEIQKLNLKWFRHQMGLVSQEPVLFNDTIRATLHMEMKEMLQNLKFLLRQNWQMPTTPSAVYNMYCTRLRLRYNSRRKRTQLSGGQKQRVAIARAIVKAPNILLLDEATSALDAESERLVQDALDQVMVNRTTIVVAHRLSTIKGAELIAVVKDGVVAEKGKHQSLISIKDGIYASLAALHASPKLRNYAEE
ncbi:hypothetical protein FEM48_Zijuj03G0037400 [Ziziphus jujuba var. spinosa]|uniref:Uncharacterized protein n=1 Tax=Ziziphus jujuba var. spinosa TaxID=714518 RepID=A0A978VMZ4_ZIZJJ|nr:hypothetical protein FEM48_Zijuj03G0037400 [Ziziphus jujuba var. spinosa]